MATTINAGQTQNYKISYLDQNGQVMVPTPTPDSAPAWSDTTPATDTLTASADGNTASVLGLPAGGSDTIDLSVTVGGQTFTASEALTVNPAAPPAQILTSVAITQDGPPTP